MQRKDYRLLADAIVEARRHTYRDRLVSEPNLLPPEGAFDMAIGIVVAEIGRALQRTNGAFNRDKFEAACLEVP